MPAVLLCPRVSPMKLDGIWEKPEWSRVAPVGMVNSVDGTEPAQRTEFKVGYDSGHLYIIYRCEDSAIFGTMTRRDDPIYDEEVVEVFLSVHHLQRYFEFEVSPLNVVFDGIISNPAGGCRQLDKEWDCQGLSTFVSRSEGFWVAELAIPFAELGVGTPVSGTEWRGNFYRIERRPVEEYSAWSPTLVEPANFHVPERFGVIRFV